MYDLRTPTAHTQRTLNMTENATKVTRDFNATACKYVTWIRKYLLSNPGGYILQFFLGAIRKAYPVCVFFSLTSSPPHFLYTPSSYPRHRLNH